MPVGSVSVDLGAMTVSSDVRGAVALAAGSLHTAGIAFDRFDADVGILDSCTKTDRDGQKFVNAFKRLRLRHGICVLTIQAFPAGEDAFTAA